MNDMFDVFNDQNYQELEFKRDIQEGLTRKDKQIPSKYFYDVAGSELFNQITRHPDYYLTKCEIQILERYKKHISLMLSDIKFFNLIELGPGEGIKTKILIQQFLEDKRNFTYIPIDISPNYLKDLTSYLQNKFPTLTINPIYADFLINLKNLKNNKHTNFILFLGSSIGNFNLQMTESFLKHLYHNLNPGDYLLLGLDLRKDINILMKAYDDSDGLTRHFNLNLLKRINRELQANFNLDQFKHYAMYNVHIGAMESYLISQKKQKVMIEALKCCITFEEIEPIHVESSKKYLLSEVNNLAKISGFKVIADFIDERQFFLNCLWQVK